MPYGTSHLLIGLGGVGGVFSGASRKILLCKGGGGSLHERGDVFCQLNLISKKGPLCQKNAEQMPKIIIEIFSSLVSLTRHFTKFVFLEQLTAMP